MDYKLYFVPIVLKAFYLQFLVYDPSAATDRSLGDTNPEVWLANIERAGTDLDLSETDVHPAKPDLDLIKSDLDLYNVDPDLNTGTVSKIPQLTDCVKVSPCSCLSSKLGLVDLNPLANTDGTARFLNVPVGVEFYSWNPCMPFSLGDCINVAACQKITFTTSSYFSLGAQTSAKFSVKDDGLVLSYSANTYENSENSSANFLRTAYVKLICDVSNDPGTFVALGEDPSSYGNYHFTLTSIHACPDSLKPKGHVPSVSVGSCLLITISAGLVLYLSIGIAVSIFACKRSGRDVIPNSKVWIAIPGLVKDGFYFVIKRGKSTPYVEFD